MAFDFKPGNEVITVKGSCVSTDYVEVGMISNNVYVIDDGSKGAIVVDPSCKPEAIRAALKGREITAFFITHGHWDHVGALAQLAAESGAPVYASAADTPLVESDQTSHRYTVKGTPVTDTVSDGDVITVGNTTWKVISTPGHTPGCVCYFARPEDNPRPTGKPVLLSGDTLFCGTIGRTDFEGGSLKDMKASLSKLAVLPADTIVLPGHNELTTIAAEKVRVFAQYA